MKIKTLTLFTLIVLFQINVFSQAPIENTAVKSSEKILKDRDIRWGNRYYKNGDLEKALYYYLKAYPNNEESDDLNLKIGLCYMFNHQAHNAVKYLEKAYSLNNKVSKDIHFLLAQTYHLNYMFEKAVKEYQTELSSLNRPDNKFRKKIEKNIKECNNGIALVKDSAYIEIKGLENGINSKFDDYLYIEYKNSTAFFTTKRDKGTGNLKNPTDDKYYEDIYIHRPSELTKNEPLSNVNSKTNDACLGFSPSKNTLFMFIDDNQGDLYYSINEQSGWSKPKSIGKPINSEYAESSMCLNKDSNIIYFVSDRNDITNHGKSDIFYSELGENDNWQEPKNIGNKINTEYSEEAVSLSKDGNTLFFSSRGHNTMGGFDIFKSERDKNGNWKEPINLGYPINSPSHDLFYVMPKDSFAHFSSVRKEGLGNMDIFVAIYMPEKEMIVEIDTIITDTTKTDVVIVEVDTTDTDIPEPKIILPDKFENYVIVKNIQFKINQHTNSAAYPNLDKLVKYLKDNPDAKIDIYGYADTQGRDGFNEEISRKRAEFVKNYLIKKGVNPNQIFTQGKGEENQLSINKDSKGNYMWNSLKYNRRVEFIVKKQGKYPLLIKQIKVPDNLKVKKEIQKEIIYSIYLKDSLTDEESKTVFNNLPDARYYKITNNARIYYCGQYKTVEQAEERLKKVKELGFSDAYIFVNEYINN